MAKKELKTEIKRLRFTELEAKQLDKYLEKHDLNFSEFVSDLISQKIQSEFQTAQEESNNKKSKVKTVQAPPKVDPALLFQIGKIGNNLNQIARSLNIIRLDSQAISKFSFLECFHDLSLMQNDLHHFLGELPKIERSPQAVEKAKERAIKKRRGEDVH
jgi:hypothetical protein